MKQTKKLTRNQREFLERKYKVDTTNARFVDETKDYIRVQFDGGAIIKYNKEV